MINMQQRIYRPPNVAGWEGGMSWLNTNTVQGRFDLVARAQYLKYSNYYRNTEDPAPPATVNYPPDIAGETTRRCSTAPTRPSTSRGSPPASEGRGRQLRRRRPRRRPPRHSARQRFYALQALMLGGPDGQVM